MVVDSLVQGLLAIPGGVLEAGSSGDVGWLAVQIGLLWTLETIYLLA